MNSFQYFSLVIADNLIPIILQTITSRDLGVVGTVVSEGLIYTQR